MINGLAWFSDGTKLGVDEADGSLRVVRLVPPWEAVVEWRGAEFTVSLFERDQVVLPDVQEPEDDAIALDSQSPGGDPLENEDQE